MTTAVPLDTERLTIRPWRPEEAARLVDILGRVEVARWLSDGEPRLLRDEAEARTRIAEWGAMPEPLGQWAIEVRETGIPAGSVLLVPIPRSEGLVQIGWHLHPGEQGRGYASEAARAVLERGLASGLEEIRALTHVHNLPSRAVATRIGMRDLGVVEQWYDEPSQLFLATTALLGD